MLERAGGESRRFLGITTLGDFILNKGIEGVLDNLERPEPRRSPAIRR